MEIVFWGAAQEVTGSMHLLEVNGKRVLFECGLFQGRRAETYERNLNFPFEAQSIDALVLSHAHIDHAGNIPNLVKHGFSGNIWCTAATRNLCTYMLLDSGKIQEADAVYVNKERARRSEPPIEPIYTRQDAQNALGQFIGVGLHRPVTVADGVEVTFFNSGHILGSASVQIDITEGGSGERRRLVFSGDIGRDEAPILKAPERFAAADFVIMESTYGDRLHETFAAAGARLQQIVTATARRRGKVIIPAFAVGRTQELVYALNELDAEGDIPPLPVYVDSPLAVDATDVFRMHPEEWDEEVQAFLVGDNRRNPFDYPHLEYVRDVRRSKRLNDMTEASIIISANGMCEAGRILHHLKNNIENPINTILLVSFMAEHTLGRRIKDGEKRVRIFGEEYDVRAQVASIEGYSAHADQTELIAWAASFDLQRLQKVFLVHGEPGAIGTLRSKLLEAGIRQVEAPARGQKVTL